jgi:rhodanese-related sulfurtransferase
VTGTLIVPIVDEGLGNSAYLVDLGQGRALAVDVPRDVRAARAAAGRRGLRIAFAADTHLHADFLSGARQLAAGDGAQILASAAGAANPLLAAGDEDAFVKTLLASLGTFPSYFLRLPEENRRGPAVVPATPALTTLTPGQVLAMQNDGGQVIDVRPVPAYAAGHIPCSLAIPLREAFATWLGWLVPDPATALVIVADPGQDLSEVIWRAATAASVLERAGHTAVAVLTGGPPDWADATGPALESTA